MATSTDIEQLSAAIAHEFHPKRIVLFGSHAWGTPDSESDVDMLIILPFEGKAWRMAAAIRERIHPSFPLDILVRTESQVSERISHRDTFMTRIFEDGKVLYEDLDLGSGLWESSVRTQNQAGF